MENEIKKLYRSRENKVVAGVIGGIGEYFDLDPVILRLVYSIVVLFTGLFPGIVVYVIASLIIPIKNGTNGTDRRETVTGGQEKKD